MANRGRLGATWLASRLRRVDAVEIVVRGSGDVKRVIVARCVGGQQRHQCDHYSLPNETGVTRLSLDFRVVLASRYLETYPGSHVGDGSSRFGVGGFFALLEP